MKWEARAKLGELRQEGMQQTQLRCSTSNALAAFISYLATEEGDPVTGEPVPVIYMYGTWCDRLQSQPALG